MQSTVAPARGLTRIEEEVCGSTHPEHGDVCVLPFPHFLSHRAANGRRWKFSTPEKIRLEELKSDATVEFFEKWKPFVDDWPVRSKWIEVDTGDFL